jgi:hypothetical protein
MLTMTRKGWLGWNYVVLDEARQPIADLSVATFGDSGSFSIQGTAYVVQHEGWFDRRFRLERDGAIVARARNGSPGHAFEIEAGESCYSLSQTSFSGPEYALLDGATRIGSVVRPSYIRPAQVQVRVDTPPAVQVFLLWLVAVLWKWQVTP